MHDEHWRIAHYPMRFDSAGMAKTGQWIFGKIQETRIPLMENGCPGWDRTSDQVINSHLLYH